jgi:CRISPR/Cas system-associated endoribonuclease Cas2
MALFSVTYDLVKEKDYRKLIDRLKELDTVKVQMSQWFLSASNTAAEVKDHLAEYIDDDDKLMVVEFSKKPSFTKAIAGTNDWLDKHF